MTIFGVKSIQINGFVLYVLKIRVCGWKSSILDKYQIPFTKVVNKKKKEYCDISLVTEDRIAFDVFSQNVGNALKEIALADFNVKYSWVRPLEITVSEKQVEELKKTEDLFNDL